MSALSTDVGGWCTVVAALVAVISFAYAVWVNTTEARADRTRSARPGKETPR